MQKLKINGQRGFTLIELMIVVAIIGILAAVAVPKFAEMLRKSKEGATKGSLSALRSALTIYASDNEGITPISRYDTGVSELAVTVAGDVQAQAGLSLAMLPKYMEAFPSAKLGTYHGDINTAHVAWSSNASYVDRSAAMARSIGYVAAYGDTNGWLYVSNNDGAFWVNCAHSDTKTDPVTGW